MECKCGNPAIFCDNCLCDRVFEERRPLKTKIKSLRVELSGWRAAEDQWEEVVRKYGKIIAQKDVELAKKEVALEYYADVLRIRCRMKSHDNGQKAREALKGRN